MKFKKFLHVQSSWQFILDQMKVWVFRRMTRNSMSLFVRGRDVISVAPLILGAYELTVTKLIDSFAEDGYNDFLIDIGANIGLNSCQNGPNFELVYMYEPTSVES